ncbi:MAG TPA: hypothetical protein DCY93_00085, partial [Firmicutes bacterium]|nr:hypothetical protein [Bacillota bacterium]
FLIADIVLNNKKVSRNYDLYLKVEKKEDQLTYDYNKYYIFYYKEDDDRCSKMSDTAFNYAEEQQVLLKPVPIYFANISTLFLKSDVETENYIGITSSDKLVVKTPCTLLEIEDKKVTKAYIKDEDIKEALKLDERKYENYDHITKKEDQLNQKEETYYIYYYSNTCAACAKIKPLVFDLIDQGKAGKVYFIDTDKVDMASGQVPKDYIGIDDYNKIVLIVTPTLIKVSGGKVVSYATGTNLLEEFNK